MAGIFIFMGVDSSTDVARTASPAAPAGEQDKDLPTQRGWLRAAHMRHAPAAVTGRRLACVTCGGGRIPNMMRVTSDGAPPAPARCAHRRRVLPGPPVHRDAAQVSGRSSARGADRWQRAWAAVPDVPGRALPGRAPARLAAPALAGRVRVVD